MIRQHRRESRSEREKGDIPVSIVYTPKDDVVKAVIETPAMDSPKVLSSNRESKVAYDPPAPLFNPRVSAEMKGRITNRIICIQIYV